MMIPLAIAMAVFAPAIVRVILGYGNFSLSAQANTSLALALFALGLPFQSLLMFLIRVFFAMKNTKAPLYSVVAVSVVMIPLIWILGLRFGAPGIAAAMSAGALINTVALWLAFKKEAAGQRFPLLVLGARQGLIIGIFACLPSGVVYHALDFWLKDSGWWAFVFQIMVTALVGFISMFIAFYVLKIASIRDFRLSKFVPKAKHESG
jgi:putative peptidoglycan lipid II flippase